MVFADKSLTSNTAQNPIKYHKQAVVPWITDRANMEQNIKNHCLDDDDTGIFMKKGSIYDPISLTPIQNRSLVATNLSTNCPSSTLSAQMKRNASYGNLGNTTEARVLVLYTGGTIGMLRNDKNGEKEKYSNHVLEIQLLQQHT